MLLRIQTRLVLLGRFRTPMFFFQSCYSGLSCGLFGKREASTSLTRRLNGNLCDISIVRVEKWALIRKDSQKFI